MLLLLSAVAFAQDTGLLELPPDTVVSLPDGHEEEVMEGGLLLPLTVPNLGEGIAKLPAGSHVVVLDPEGKHTPYLVPGKSWILPDSYYRTALTKSKQLDICQPALDACTETSLAWQERTYAALEKASAQFDSDEELVNSQVQEIAKWEAQAYSYKDQRDTARQQRNVAWAITGGLILGSATVIVVAIAP
jgi:hypothetical protein